MLAVQFRLYLIIIAGSFLSLASHAQVSSGIWFNYKYQTQPSDNPDQETWGTLGDEAIILYLDHQAKASPWLFSAEFRAGPGSFTDPNNNSTGSIYFLFQRILKVSVVDAYIIMIAIYENEICCATKLHML